MALWKVNFTVGGRMQVAFVEGPDTGSAFARDRVRASFDVATADRVKVTGVRVLEDDEWFATDRDGVMVTTEEGDVEFGEPILQTEKITVWGSESAQEMLVEAGVDEGYQQVADEAALAAPESDDDVVVGALTKDAWDTIRLALDGEFARLITLRDGTQSRIAAQALREAVEQVQFALAAVESLLDDED